MDLRVPARCATIPPVRRFTLLTIIALLTALIVAGIVQFAFFAQDDRPPVPAPSPTQME
jgi:hypothetical protein